MEALVPSFLRLSAVVQANGISSSVVHSNTNEKSAGKDTYHTFR